MLFKKLFNFFVIFCFVRSSNKSKSTKRKSTLMCFLKLNKVAIVFKFTLKFLLDSINIKIVNVFLLVKSIIC